MREDGTQSFYFIDIFKMRQGFEQVTLLAAPAECIQQRLEAAADLAGSERRMHLEGRWQGVGFTLERLVERARQV